MADKSRINDSRLDVLRRQQQKAEQATIADTLRRRQEEEDEFKRKETIASQLELSPQETKKYVDRPELATPFETIKEAAGVVKQPEGTEKTLAAKVTQTPSTVPVVGEGTKPSKPEATTTSVASQPETKKAKTLAGTIADARAGKGAAGGKASDDKVQKDTISTLDDVVKQVNEDQNFQYSPVRTDLISLRADAYKAYKEKANRNEWLDLAEKALNAIGQFAAARSATGGFVAGFPQSKTDYAGRTEQAFREYQTELGTIGEQARAEERGAERLEAQKEREIARRQRTISERLADERAARAEAASEKRALIAAGGKESVAAAKKEATESKEAYKRLGTQLTDINKEESLLQKQIAAINKLGISKNSEDETKALAEIASLVPDLTVEQLKADIDSADDALTFRSTAKNQVASSLLGPLKQKIQQLGARKEALYGARAGEQPVPETAPTAAPARQLPRSVVVQGKTYPRPDGMSDADWQQYITEVGGK
jgi:hypothetical protein